jgi:ribosomal protein S18 acetylase RimI-like enzyme
VIDTATTKSKIRIIKPTKDDIVPLWKWGEENRELWSDTKTKWYPKKTLVDWVKNPGKDILLVAKNGNPHPVGMCMTYTLRGWGYCTGLFVDKKYRRMGIGTKLMRETIRQLKKRHVYHLSFMVDPKNHKGLRMYKKLGFNRGFHSVCLYKTLKSH